MMWITRTLKRIIMAHAVKFLFNERGGPEEDIAAKDTQIATLTTELATAKEASGKSFFNSLSEGVRGDPSMMKFEKTSNEDIAKSYINLQGKISAKGLLIPGKDASNDEKNAFYKELGRPDTADSYQIALPQDLHKSLQSDAASQKVFKDQCHKVGLNSGQVQDLHTWYITELSNVLKQQDDADTKTLQDAETALRGKWGTTYDAKLALGVRVLQKFTGDKAQALMDKGIMNDPTVIEMLSNIGDKLSEDTLGPGGKGQFGGLTPAAAQAKIDQIRGDKNHAYHDSNNPLHKEAVQEMTSLYQITTSGGA